MDDSLTDPAPSLDSLQRDDRHLPRETPTDQKTVITKQEAVPDDPTASSRDLRIERGPAAGMSLVGTTLAHLRLEEFVGGGGMGFVYRGIDTRLGRTVAVKVLSRDRTDLETLRRFENEAQSAARLDHENIARVHYVGEDRGLHFIVFEFIDGINVRDLVEQKGMLSLAEAISYTLQVAEALEHASQRSVVHRDIKPSNVLVTADGRAKLVDMGLARLHQVESGAKDLTASGVTLGTFDYISPEQARDPRAADVRSDLYSLGCTLYFMLTGRPPFPEGTVLQKLLSHSGEDPADPRVFRPDLDDQVVGVLNRLLAKQPAQRYQRPSELIGELLLIAERLKLSGVVGGGRVWVAPQSWLVRIERSLPWSLPLLVLVGFSLLLEHRLPEGDVLPPKPQLAGAASIAVRVDAPEEPTSPQPSAVTRPDDGGQDSGSRRPATELNGTGTPAPPPVAPDAGPSASTVDTSVTREETPGPADPRSQGEALSTAGNDRSESGSKPEVERVVVASDDTLQAPGTVVVRDLESAIRLAAMLRVDTIELRCDGELEERPLDIAGERLTIRAADGCDPTVVFHPGSEDLSIDRQLIRVSASELNWIGVDVHLELPVASADGWSLFAVEGVRVIHVQDAVLTIRNVDAQGRPLHAEVAFFELLGVRPKQAASDASLAPLPPCLALENCLLRGQGAGVRSRQATPFRLSCRHCLVVTPEHLVDVEGARLKSADIEGPIDLVLNHVTASLGKSLCRLSSSEQSPYQQVLVTDGGDNIFSFAVQDAPVIERRGASGLEAIEKRLFLRGRNNFYLNTSVLLRVNAADDPARYLDFGFDDRDGPWFQEESPRFQLLWQSLPPRQLTADRHAAYDYLLVAAETNPAMNVGRGEPAGADIRLLPIRDD